MPNPKIPEKEEPEKKEEKEMLPIEKLQEIVEKWVKEESERNPKRKTKLRSFIENRYSQIKMAIQAEGGMLGFIAEKVFPLLYFPAWKEMWKLREEQRRREILYASVGKTRNLFEAVLRGITGGLAGETVDYERRYQMISVKKELEELAGQEESYLRYELRRALKRGKLDRAEACVRLLHPDANFNEILKDEELGEFGYTEEEKKEFGNLWGASAAYFWLVKQFGRKRAQYMALDFAKDFSNGIATMDQWVYCDPETGQLTERDPLERAMAGAIHYTKIATRAGWRKIWTFSMIDVDLDWERRKEMYQEMEDYFKIRIEKIPEELREKKKRRKELEEEVKNLFEKLDELKRKKKLKPEEESDMYDLESKIIPQKKKELRRIKGEIYELENELSDLREEYLKERIDQLRKKKELTDEEKKEKEELEKKLEQKEKDEREYQEFKEKIEKGIELSPEEKSRYDFLRIRLKKIKKIANLWLLSRLCLLTGADIERPVDEDMAGDVTEMLEAVRGQIEAFVFGGVKVGERYFDFKTEEVKMKEIDFETLIREIYWAEFKREITDKEIEEKRETIRRFLRAIHLRNRGYGREDWDLETGLPK